MPARDRMTIITNVTTPTRTEPIWSKARFIIGADGRTAGRDLIVSSEADILIVKE